MKTYTKPTMLVVKLQATDLVCQSIHTFSSNADLNYGGASDANSGDPRVKESTGIWDNEW